MKHCYTECKLVSSDEYRARYDCVICKKQFYQLKDRSATAVESKDSYVAGSVLLIKGTPHITCGNRDCNQLERLQQAKTIRIFIRWEETEPEYVYVVVNNTRIRTVKQKFKPLIKTTKGCEKCANYQDSETQKNGKPHYFNMENNNSTAIKVLPASTVKYAPKPEVTVVPTAWQSAPKAGVSPPYPQVVETPTLSNEEKAIKKYEKQQAKKERSSNGILFGPFNDRKPQ